MWKNILSHLKRWLKFRPCDKYAAILHAVLVGKGLKVFAELNTEDCKDYPKLKQALLNAYSVVSEVHRSRFRNRTKQSSETYSDFAFFLAMHCKRWLEKVKKLLMTLNGCAKSSGLSNFMSGFILNYILGLLTVSPRHWLKQLN